MLVLIGYPLGYEWPALGTYTKRGVERVVWSPSTGLNDLGKMCDSEDLACSTALLRCNITPFY